jgi:hypothetical protein
MFASQMSGGKGGKLLPAVRQGHADPEGNLKKILAMLQGSR